MSGEKGIVVVRMTLETELLDKSRVQYEGRPRVTGLSPTGSPGWNSSGRGDVLNPNPTMINKNFHYWSFSLFLNWRPVKGVLIVFTQLEGVL